MMHSVDHLRSFSIRADDGDIGSVQDVLFDELDWNVRWLAVDTGHWLPGRLVVLPPSVLGVIDEASWTISAGLTRDQVKSAPALAEHQPISRQKESEIYSHYGWQPYWPDAGSGIGVPPLGAMQPGPVPPAMGKSIPPPVKAEPHLRSATAVTGSAVQATDGEIGHVEDFLIEAESWVVRYIVVDTANWWPGKKTIVAPDWISGINWAESSVSVDMTREKIKGSPEYIRGPLVTRPFEGQLYNYYGRTSYRK